MKSIYLIPERMYKRKKKKTTVYLKPLKNVYSIVYCL